MKAILRSFNKLKEHLSFTLNRSRLISGECEMFFVVSPGRSGSTLLRKLLMEKYFVHIPPESSVIIPQIFGYFLRNFPNKLSKQDIPLLVDRFFNHEFEYWGISREEIFDCISEKLEDSPLLMDEMIQLMYGLHRQKFNPSANRIGDKTPFLVFYIRHIKHIFPKARMIFLIRNPLAVIPSRMQNFNENLVQATNRWLWSAKEMKRHLSDSTLIVRYEDLIEGTELPIIGDFLQLTKRKEDQTLSAQMLGDTFLTHHSRTSGKITGNRNVVLSKSLSHSDKTFIIKKAGRLMTYFGYS